VEEKILYGVGVGPGDPELMTIKAVRLIRENRVIALPGRVPRETAAYRIAVQAVPELSGKKLLPLEFPMTEDPEKLAESRRVNAALVEEELLRGENVVFLTLGDVSIYSTFSELRSAVEKDGFKTAAVSGIPSFCAAAARAGIPLCERREKLLIIPALPENRSGESVPPCVESSGGRAVSPCAEKTVSPKKTETCVLMKSGSSLGKIRDRCRDAGLSLCVLENCGMPGERICRDPDEVPDKGGYFTLAIVRGPRAREILFGDAGKS
jgi:precorrin-2/cobalt-factor-2 C20-methyltransferase